MHIYWSQLSAGITNSSFFHHITDAYIHIYPHSAWTNSHPTKAKVLYSYQHYSSYIYFCFVQRIVSQWLVFLFIGTYVIIKCDKGHKRSMTYIFKLFKQAHILIKKIAGKWMLQTVAA